MAKDVIMPALGMAQESGVLIRWLVPEGGTVSEGDPLMEVETDKAVVEVPATASGTLAGVAFGEGVEVSVGTVLAVVLAPGETLGSRATATTVAASPGQAASPAPALPATAPGVPVSLAVAPAGGQAQDQVVFGSRAVVLASPKAKRLARERGIDLTEVRGSGPDGAVRSTDLLTEPVTGRVDAATVLPAATVTPAAGHDAAWLRATIDLGGLREFLDRVSRSGLAPPGSAIETSDVLTRVVAAGLSRNTGFGEAEFSVLLTRFDADGGVLTVPLQGEQLASILSVSGSRGRAQTGQVAPAQASGTGTGGQLQVAIVDQSSDSLERSPTALGSDTPIRLTLGRAVETVSLRGGEPVMRDTASLHLDYDRSVLDDARAAALINYVSRLLGDPFALAVQG